MTDLRDSLAQVQELKPCPFCGGTARIDEGMRGYPCILCGTCGASSDYASTDDVSEAISAWNTRHGHSPDAGKLGEDAARYRWIVRRPKSKITIDSQWGEQRISFTTTDAESFIDSAREQAARAG
jgi:Lar family restriction alleviation protein